MINLIFLIFIAGGKKKYNKFPVSWICIWTPEQRQDGGRNKSENVGRRSRRPSPDRLPVIRVLDRICAIHFCRIIVIGLGKALNDVLEMGGASSGRINKSGTGAHRGRPTLNDLNELYNFKIMKARMYDVSERYFRFFKIFRSFQCGTMFLTVRLV